MSATFRLPSRYEDSWIMVLQSRPIDSNWTLSAVEPPPHVAERFVKTIPAKVPGNVHLDLLASRLIADPYLDTNELTADRVGTTTEQYDTDPPPIELVHPEVCLEANRRPPMPKKRHKPEEIVARLRQVDVIASQGQSVADAVRAIGVTEVTYYCWRSELGGLKSDQVKRLKDLEAENARLRRAVADLTLDKQILKEAASGPEGQRQQNF
jgi:transposase-like protein